MTLKCRHCIYIEINFPYQKKILPQNKSFLESATDKTTGSRSNVVCFQNVACGKSHTKHKTSSLLSNNLN